MRRFSIALAPWLSILLTTGIFAQRQVFTPPDAFYGAQRGHVVAHAHGGYRLHYGRGLTPGGAQTFQSLIMTSPQIIGALSPFFSPMSVGSSAMLPVAPSTGGNSNQAAFLPPDSRLDALANPSYHQARMANLDNILQGTNQVVISVGRTPVSQLSLVGVGEPTTPPPSTGMLLQLRVAKAPSLRISDADIEEALAVATRFLQTDDDGPGPDTAVDIELRMMGMAEQYHDPTGRVGSMIDSDNQLIQLKSENRDYDILIVESLAVCGTDIGTGIVGCATLNDIATQIVVEMPPPGFAPDIASLRGVIIAHELCHNGGAEHKPVPFSLMNPFVSQDTKVIDANEAQQLVRLLPAQPAVDPRTMTPTGGAVGMPRMEGVPIQGMNIHEAMKMVYVEGHPWANWRATFKRLAAEPPVPPAVQPDAPPRADSIAQDIRFLRTVLEDIDQEIYHENAVVLLTAIGKKESVDAVVEYLRRHFGSRDPELASAARQAVIALGLLARELDPQRKQSIEKTIADLLHGNMMKAAKVVRGAMLPEEMHAQEREESQRFAAINALAIAGSDYFREFMPLPGTVTQAAATLQSIPDLMNQRGELRDFAERLYIQAKR